MLQDGRNRIARIRAARDHTRVGLLLLAGITATIAFCWQDEAPRPSAVLNNLAEPVIRTAVRVRPSDAGQLALVQEVALDQWSMHVALAQPVLDVVVDEDGLARLSTLGVAWELLVPDIDAVAEAERERLQRPKSQRPTDWFADYHDFEAINARLEWLAAEHPELISLSVIGNSIEGRPLLALQLGGRDEAAVPMLINGGQHAREWIAAIVPVCITERLLGGYETDASLRAFVDGTRLWVVPVVNPDGYQYSWSSDRYWRKNRRDDHGVDLNRNFSVAFGGPGSSANKRSQTYRGPHAFSEPETQALRHLVRRESIALHIDFHAYGQLLLHPWAHTKTPSSERDRFAAIADHMASAIFATHGQRYEILAGAELYPAAGTMSDWMYGEADALSFTIELRPNGKGGFVLPPEQIRPTCDEALAATLELRKAVVPPV
jgi:murein tripeptide amidase MpaA